ncbi:ABC transporter ATP-binding protein [Clostridium sp. L74]|uniref:amino acid ABC transporter ATP-binding/permease protein n=1 Tax=Clostridium sp. L74 TaxID=1560217 RepID=UPI0006AB7EB0|nr:ABC transporter ATP-binding protein [Clostridium sp. L74]KOR23853.1 ABC transporter ATP-binding protein [Clostridium sp. L74]
MKRKSGFSIMKRLILEVKPLMPIMIITVTMGVLGFLSAISITSFGAVAIGNLLGGKNIVSFNIAIVIITISAVLRGLFRYVEQLSGHYIAFKILAILRDKVFTSLRKLAPAKLEIKEKGNLISIITSDIELLEVFYAHTIAPILIAIITSTIITIVLFNINNYFGILAIVFYFIIGFIIPYYSSKIGNKSALEYRNTFGETNSYLLDSLRGLKEILIYDNGQERLDNMNKNSNKLNEKLNRIKNHEGIIRAATDFAIMLAIVTYSLVGYKLYVKNILEVSYMILAIVIIASSFGPVVALSNLSNNLLYTFASAERVFNILDEEPIVEEVYKGEKILNTDIECNDVSFSYDGRKNKILENVSLFIDKKEKIAIIGESGTGKSTFVKLIMRFWDVNKGGISIGRSSIKNIETKNLRRNQTLISQETFLFNETIEDNIKMGNINASREQVIESAKKASIHDFIENLPKGYETKVGELGGNLSSGEKQRIGLARAFINEAPILILDEPTSNLDTLNEGQILKAINENCEHRSIILISHRKSTTAICNKTIELKNSKMGLVESSFALKSIENDDLNKKSERKVALA